MNLLAKSMQLSQWVRVLAVIGGSAAVLGALAATSGIAGDAPTEVKDPVYVDQDSSTVNTGGTGTLGASAGFVTLKDGIAFNAAVNTYAGDVYYVQLSLVNQSTNSTFDEVLKVSGPSGFEFEVSGGSNIDVSQKTVDSWIVRIRPDADGADVDLTPAVTSSEKGDDELRIEVTVGPGVATGFYQVKANLTLLTED